MRSGQQLIIAVGSDSTHGPNVSFAEVAEAQEPASHGSLLTSKPALVFTRSVIIAAEGSAVAAAVLSCCFY